MAKPKNDWRAIVAAYKTSGQHQKQWCQENNININNLKCWLQKEKKTISLMETSGKPRRWLSLDIDAPRPVAGEQRLKIHIGQACLEINPGFDPEFLTDVIRAVMAAC